MLGATLIAMLTLLNVQSVEMPERARYMLGIDESTEQSLLWRIGFDRRHTEDGVPYWIAQLSDPSGTRETTSSDCPAVVAGVSALAQFDSPNFFAGGISEAPSLPHTVRDGTTISLWGMVIFPSGSHAQKELSTNGGEVGALGRSIRQDLMVCLEDRSIE